MTDRSTSSKTGNFARGAGSILNLQPRSGGLRAVLAIDDVKSAHGIRADFSRVLTDIARTTNESRSRLIERLVVKALEQNHSEWRTLKNSSLAGKASSNRKLAVQDLIKTIMEMPELKRELSGS